ncbi:MAG: LPD38 domain-containing protein, partial [Hyphomicrobiales bacterium]
TFWNQAESIDQIKARLQSEARAAGRSAVDPRRWANAVGRTVENVNAGIENAIRLSTYANARKMGLSPARAASIAKNVTVNFSRRGTAGPAMNSLYMFFNASVQGTAALLTSMRSPRVRKRLGYVAAFGAAVTLMNMILDEEDDDGESFYAKISDFDKQRNLIIMLPGTDGQHLKIPLPYGHNVFYGMGRGAIEGVFGRPALEVAGDLGVAAIESFNPVGGASSLLNLIAPTVVDPIVDLSRNRDFADRPIMPDQPAYDTPLPDAQRYWSSVSPIWRTVTEALTDLTGGDQVKPGAIDVSP